MADEPLPPDQQLEADLLAELPSPVPAVNVWAALVGIKNPERMAYMLQKASEIDEAKLVQDKLQAFMDTVSKDPNAEEQSNSGGGVELTPSAVEGLPDRQAISSETAKYVGGVLEIIAILLPLIALGMSIWQQLQGLGSLIGMLQSLISATGGEGKHGAAAQKASMAIQAALDGVDIDDPDAVNEAANTVMVPPVEGLTNTEMKLGDFLDRVMPKMPCVGVPEKPADTPKSKTPGERCFDVAKTPDTRLVNPSASTPPKCSLVSTNGLRSDSNIFKNFGNPAAALQDDVNLAMDLNNLAGQHKNVAKAASDLKDAAQALADGNYALSLILSLRSLLKGLVTYNYQTDSKCTITGTTKRSLKWWNDYNPPPQILDPRLNEKIANGQKLTEAEALDYNDAVELLKTKAVIAAGEQTRLGSMPGTLVYAAIEDSAWVGSLDSLIDQIVILIARRQGVDNYGVTTLQSIIYDASQDDSRVLEIPDIIMGADERIQNNRPAVYRWLDTLKYITAMPKSYVDALKMVEADVSTGSLLFINMVKQSKLDFEAMKTKLLRHDVDYQELLDLYELSEYWDELNSVLFIDPTQQHPVAVQFLTELLACRPNIPDARTITLCIKWMMAATLAVGGPLGTDLAQLCGVVGAIQRTCLLLEDPNVAVKLKESKAKALLGHGDEMSKPVGTFPNPGILGRISEAL